MSPFFATMNARHFKKELLALPVEEFQSHYISVFDLTPLQDVQDAVEQLHYQELSRKNLS